MKKEESAFRELLKEIYDSQVCEVINFSNQSAQEIANELNCAIYILPDLTLTPACCEDAVNILYPIK